MRLLLVRRMLETSVPSATEKTERCRLGEVSALYDVLLVSVEARVAVVTWVEMEEVVSLRGGGEPKPGGGIWATDEAGEWTFGPGSEPGDRAGEKADERLGGARAGETSMEPDGWWRVGAGPGPGPGSGWGSEPNRRRRRRRWRRWRHWSNCGMGPWLQREGGLLPGR